MRGHLVLGRQDQSIRRPAHRPARSAMADTWVIHRLNCKALPSKGEREWHLKIMSNKRGNQ